MDYFLTGTGVLLTLVGIAGCILPGLPGPPLNYFALILLHITTKYQLPVKILVVWAIVTLLVTLIDYLIPVWGAKKFGAGKRGIYGSIAGLILGMFIFPPFGLILGPFAGAVIGELSAGKQSGQAMKAGFGSFIGFFSGMLLKLIASGWMTWYFARTVIG